MGASVIVRARGHWRHDRSQSLTLWLKVHQDRRLSKIAPSRHGCLRAVSCRAPRSRPRPAVPTARTNVNRRAGLDGQREGLVSDSTTACGVHLVGQRGCRPLAMARARLFY